MQNKPDIVKGPSGIDPELSEQHFALHRPPPNRWVWKANEGSIYEGVQNYLKTEIKHILQRLILLLPIGRDDAPVLEDALQLLPVQSRVLHD